MTQRPPRELTFLFSDIEGSTSRWEHHHEAMSAALRRHDALVRAAIEAHGGHVFKTVGDAFFAVFDDGLDALRAAVGAQQALASERWEAFGAGFPPLRVRMGLHAGTAEARGDDYFGPALNRTARLMSAGHGGQVLISATVRAGIEGRLPAGFGLRDLGEHRLKDLRHSERIGQVTAEGLADVARPPTTAGELGARDRIVVRDADDEDADGVADGRLVLARTLGETLAALRGVVVGDARSEVFTPAQLREAAAHPPRDLDGYRLGRIAEWSQPRHRLDARFVALTLLVDQGEEARGGRWAPRPERYDGLGAVLAAAPEPALVVLGPPGSGKSTLLRHLELDIALDALRGGDPDGPVTLYASLSQYGASGAASALSPGAWLERRWSEARPDLPPLDALLRAGRVILLLDALNEVQAPSERAFREQVGRWKDWLVDLSRERPGNRVVFSCRTLDYSASLSTPELRVPQVQIEPLSDDQVAAFLRLHSPIRGEAIWAALVGTPQLEVLRAPFFLGLLVEQVEATGELAQDRSGLFTRFVRQALRREVERDSPVFAIEELLSGRDVRRIAQWQWRDDYDLPERGLLVPKLADLAYEMQTRQPDGGASQVRVDYDIALEILSHEHDEAILRAGLALRVLDEDPAADDVLYFHQLLQEYFAARILARAPRPDQVAAPWRAAEVAVGVRDALAVLPPSERLPGLPTTGWEETAVLAAAMAEDPGAFVDGLMPANLPVAGRAADLPTVRPRLSADRLDRLRAALRARSRDPDADLRARIEAGLALGRLGDPRLAEGPAGALVPPVVPIAAGVYPIGDDEPIRWVGAETSAHVPRHEVRLGAFAIGRFPVTNAEYARFLAAGGYEEARWWDTAAARSWRAGIGTAAGLHASTRHWLEMFRARPELMDDYVARGNWNEDLLRLWQGRLAMTAAEFDAELHRIHPEQRLTEPRHWRDERFNAPAQPVVGVSWFEARAYCAWLSAATGDRYRLPSEVEWEAAARGHARRAYAYGDDFDPLAANTAQTKLRRPTPVGVFVEGDTPEGASDLTGTVDEWTASAFGLVGDEAEHVYPYRADDGREDPDLPPEMRRVVRGGSWMASRLGCLAAARNDDMPDFRSNLLGFRVVLAARGA